MSECSINLKLLNKMETRGESLRQQKVAAQLQKDISDIFSREMTTLSRGVILTVTKVRMSPDLALAKVYLSVFPFGKSEEVVARVREGAATVRGSLGRRVRNQLRIVPELAFFVDDSMEYAENIDRLINS